MKLMFVAIILYNIAYSQSLKCVEILELPSNKKLDLMELKTIQPKDIVECLAHLGKERLPDDESDFIWQSLIKFYEGINNIPNSVLTNLHWVTTAVKPEDYSNITLDNIDVIENFGLNYNLHRGQIMAIANRVREDFAGKEPQDYTYYDLVALKQILCQFNRSEIERIHASAYREAALMIGKLENCDAEAMAAFATLATHSSAFGSPDTWTDATIKTIGKVADYLPQDVVARVKVTKSDVEESTKRNI